MCIHASVLSMIKVKKLNHHILSEGKESNCWWFVDPWLIFHLFVDSLCWAMNFAKQVIHTTA